MDWIVLEEFDGAGARLTALRLADGARRLLYEAQQDTPLRAALHPEMRRAAVDVHTRSTVHGAERARVALLNLEQSGRSWLRPSLDPRWRLSGLVFAPDGRRFAVEATADGATGTEVQVFDLSLTRAASTEKLIGGVAHPQGLACARPAWLPGGDRFVCLRADAGGWRAVIADLGRVGPPEPDRAPAIHTAALDPRADLALDAGLVVDPRGRHALAVALVGDRRRLVRLPLDGGPAEALSAPHHTLARPAIAPDGGRVAWIADGRVWLAEPGRDPQTIAGDAGDELHCGVCFAPDGETVWFVTRAPHGVTLDACDLAAGVPYPVAQIDDTTVIDLIAVPDHPQAALRLAERPEAPARAGGFVDGATSITRLADADRGDTAIGGDTEIGADDDDDGEDGTLAGDLTVDGTIDCIDAPAELDADGLAATAMHDALDLAPADNTAVHEAIDLAPAEPARRLLGRALTVDPDEQTAIEAPVVPERPPARAPIPSRGRGVVPARPAPASPSGPFTPPAAPPPLAPPPTPAAPSAAPSARPAPPPTPAAPPARPAVPPPTPAAPPPPPVDDLDESIIEASLSSLAELDPDDPPVDFRAWMDRLPSSPDPGGRLAELERYAADARLAVAAVTHLEERLGEALTGGADATLPLIFAISAVAHLRIEAARPQLRALCRRALDRLDVQRGIPEAEEHFALAALRAIDDAGVRFAAMVSYEEYQTILTKIAEGMAEGGGVAERVRTFYLERYRQRLGEALAPTAAEEIDTAAREALELAAQQQLQREIEALRRAAAEQRAAELRAEAERDARADAARIAAAHVGARLAERASVAEEAEWSRRVAAIQQQTAAPEARARPADPRAALDARGPARVPMRGAPSRTATADADPWAAARADAEARAADERAPDPWAAAADRARGAEPAQPDPWAAAADRARGAEPAQHDPWAAAADRARGAEPPAPPPTDPRSAGRARAADERAPDPWAAAADRARGAEPAADPWTAAADRARGTEPAAPPPTDPRSAGRARAAEPAQPDPWAAADRARGAEPAADPWAAAADRARGAEPPGVPRAADPWTAAADRARGAETDPYVAAAAPPPVTVTDPYLAARPAASPPPAPRARDEARAAAEARALAEDRAAAEARAAELARWQAEEERFRAEANRPRPITASGDEWARRRAEAEVAARVAAVDRLQRAETAQVTSPGDAYDFNPLGTASSMPRPAIREPRPLPAGAPPPDLDHATGSDEHRFGATSAEWATSGIDRSPLPAAAPKALPAIGFAGVVAGVGLALLGVKLGAGFIGFGALWAIAGMALIGDRRGAWLFAIAAYLLNALFLIGYGLAGDPPVWIPAAGLIAGGVATVLVTAALLHPVFRDRYRAGRPRF